MGSHGEGDRRPGAGGSFLRCRAEKAKICSFMFISTLCLPFSHMALIAIAVTGLYMSTSANDPPGGADRRLYNPP
ncbi:hypothetical protein PV02_09905 [Methanolobus chelungpuianus]|uniref:Uncharacterized protein n=1 Tax=Methanolobus chelungpuianus TaxID=502115 RepID=A0AAE3HB20_9EURY|nr:hypothetical protein [Methanolobus chelungpuianus]